MASNPPEFGMWQHLIAADSNGLVPNLIRDGYEVVFQRKIEGDDTFVRKVRYLSCHADVATWTTGQESPLEEFLETNQIQTDIVVNVGYVNFGAPDIAGGIDQEFVATYPGGIGEGGEPPPWFIEQLRVQDNGNNTSRIFYVFRQETPFVLEVIV